MCGICGIVRFDKQIVQEEPILKMMLLMKHRGPDDEGIFMDENVGLGFVRLSIIDLSAAGHQPMPSKDGRYAIVFNGEIYNYIELREELQKEGVLFNTKTDTEVLLNAYIHWGEDCMHRFNGMWAFAIYDKQNKSIFAARDRFGVKPFYYIQTKKQFAFCSEIPSLLTILDQKPKPNYQSIFDFLVFNRTDQTENTFFEAVKKLQHGHKLHIKNNEVSIAKWYDLKKQVSETEGFKNALEYKEMFSSSIGLRLRSDVPVGVCLSGGLDSSSVVSVLLNDFGKKDINTFSAVYQKDQIGDETEFIHEYKPLLVNMHFTTPTAKGFEADLKEFLSAHAEPIPSTSAYAEYKVMELAKKNIVVSMGGQGADEQLAGYHYFFGFYFKDLFKRARIGKLSTELFQYLNKHRSLFGFKSFVYFMLPERLRTKLRVNEKNYLNSNFITQYQDKNSIAGNLYGSGSLKNALSDHFEYKLEHLLKWEDRNSMHFSIESRVPFLDYRLVEKTLATSSDWVIRKGMTKYILREAMKGILPEKIRMRRDKVGYGTPEDEWFREPAWQKIIKEILNSESFKNRKIVNPAKAVSQFEKHVSGKINISKEIWKWIHLELWFREFIDENKSSSTESKRCSLGIWDHTIPGIKFDEQSVSNYAIIQQNLMKDFPLGEKGMKDWENNVEKIKNEGKGKAYDCIIGVSGGTDSSYLLHLAKEYGLRPLAVNLDNGWSSDIALKNIRKMTSALNIDLETYVINYEEIKDILRSYLRAGLPWIDNPTDQAIQAILYKFAKQQRVKTILIGTDFRSEGKQPTEWTYSDRKQLKFVQKQFGSEKLKTYPMISLFNKAYLGYLKGIKFQSPFNYLSYNKQAAQKLLIEKYAWEYYGEHHHENLFTKWTIGYWMYEKFGIDKRLITYSAQVLNGIITRDEALAIVSKKPYDDSKIESETNYVLKKLGIEKTEYDKIWNSPNKSFRDYPSHYPLILKFMKLIKPIASKVLSTKPKMFYEMEQRDDNTISK